MIRGYTKIILLWLTRVFVGEKPHVSVLMYHSVSGGATKYDVPLPLFERQIEFLIEHYKIIHLDDVVSYAKGERELKRTEIAITIDDGYLDTYTNIFPILKKYKIPAAVFLTSNLDKKNKLSNIDRLNKEQIKEMHDSKLISFEVHGRDHLNLKDLSREKFKEELGGCREDIISYTGKIPKYVAYASGHRNKEVEDGVKSLGFEAGFGITEGVINKEDNLYRLRRVQIDRTMPFILFVLRTKYAMQSYNKIISWFRGKK